MVKEVIIVRKGYILRAVNCEDGGTEYNLLRVGVPLPIANGRGVMYFRLAANGRCVVRYL